MGKHLNAGHAAASGLRAARLVAAGFDAPPDAIEAPQGFAATQSPGFDADRRKHDARFGVEQVIFKRYACCADTHSAIEGIRAIATRRPLSAAEIVGVDLSVADGLLDVCDIAEPTTGTEGKFSVRYATALAIAGHAAGPDDFTDAAVRRPALVDLAGRVRVRADHHGHAADPIAVTVHFTDGATEQAKVNPLVPVSDADLGAQWDALAEKATQLAQPVVDDQTAALFQVIQSLPVTSARDVISATIPVNPDND
jgi:2-methylcitrate dehydratase PrpD